MLKKIKMTNVARYVKEATCYNECANMGALFNVKTTLSNMTNALCDIK